MPEVIGHLSRTVRPRCELHIQLGLCGCGYKESLLEDPELCCGCPFGSTLSADENLSVPVMHVRIGRRIRVLDLLLERVDVFPDEAVQR